MTIVDSKVCGLSRVTRTLGLINKCFINIFVIEIFSRLLICSYSLTQLKETQSQTSSQGQIFSNSNNILSLKANYLSVPKELTYFTPSSSKSAYCFCITQGQTGCGAWWKVLNGIEPEYFILLYIWYFHNISCVLQYVLLYLVLTISTLSTSWPKTHTKL